MEENKTKKEGMDSIRVTELVDDDDSIFESFGESKLKVTKGGEVKSIVLPIKSTGVADLVDAFSRKAPKPPEARELIDPKSETGKEMGLSKKTWVRMPNYADPSYIARVDKHNQDLGMAIMLQGLAITFKDKSGNVIDDPDEKVAILRRKGLTGDHFIQITQDIQSLTRWNDEEMHDFFVES